ncbi:DUF3592 domain-containing protein [Actinophytocola algeriensis]|uniref:DUF3592 domain-containing protein n=1 Tax=Actinophytocola algeriensis TaxID=1768010 RepID=A0A7W7QCY8_9PSEU|nr:DUF3592 domain-containing protein [Actinophytocola algeriensis]MBB4911302.1 hypothetical protein [Actinophytocola algeriensis]MBE1479241.1 hypothetical protein [Actinophytocola algeriensis]
MDSTIKIIGGALMVIIGLAGIWSSSRSHHLQRKGFPAIGTVVKHVPQNDSLDHPVIQFIDYHGRAIQFVDHQGPESEHVLGSLNRFVPVGEQVSLVYDPRRPSRVLIKSQSPFRSLTAGVAVGFILLAFGSLILTMGLLRVQKLNWEPNHPEMVVIPCLAMVVSLSILVAGAWRVRRLFVLQRVGFKATGVVTRTIKAKSGLGFSIGPLLREGSKRKPVIDFIDYAGRRFQVLGSRGPRSIGAEVPVVYLPSQPHVAVVAPPMRNVTLPLYLMLVGLLMTLASMFSMLFVVFISPNVS